MSKRVMSTEELDELLKILDDKFVVQLMIKKKPKPRKYPLWIQIVIPTLLLGISFSVVCGSIYMIFGGL